MSTKPKKAPDQPAIAPTPAPAPVVAKSATADLEDMVNRAYNRPMTQEERAFLASVRRCILDGQEVTEFDRGWLTELAGR